MSESFSTEQPDRPEKKNPYVGPRTFEERHAGLFFGREEEARDLISFIISEPLVLFHAQSGAGKSSLINTRLVPSLRDDEGFFILPTGRVSGTLPDNAEEIDNVFVYNLLQKLNQGELEPEELGYTTIRTFLRRHRQGAREPEKPRVLIIDQFEELINRHQAFWHHREPFFRQLDQALRTDSRLWVVLTLRDDYVAAIESYAGPLQGRLGARFHMQRMGYEAALEAVKQPALRANPKRPYAKGVAEKLVENLSQVHVHGSDEPHLGEFVEPVQLQVVCYQLWEKLKDREAAEITLTDLEELGDVDVALADFYEQALAKVQAKTNISELTLRNWFEYQLITESETRGTVFQGTEETAGLDNAAVLLLADQFLLRSEGRAGGTWYELVHDRFVKPILQSNQRWRQRQGPVLEAAERWERAERNPDKLIDGAQLREARSTLDKTRAEPLVIAFLEASQKAEKERIKAEEQKLRDAEERADLEAKTARRFRSLSIVLLVAVVVSLASLVVSYIAYRQLEDTNRQLADARAENARMANIIAVQEVSRSNEDAPTSVVARLEAEATARTAGENAQLRRATADAAATIAAEVTDDPEANEVAAAEAARAATAEAQATTSAGEANALATTAAKSTLQAEATDDPEAPEFVQSEAQDFIQLINAMRSRSEFDVTGEGLTVAVLDTGLNTTHVDFEGRIVAQKNFTPENDGNADDATDGNGHGTTVGGIIVANGDHVGVAPEANIIPIKVLQDRGGGSFQWISSALQWVLDNHETYNITVAVLSLGDGSNRTSDDGLENDPIKEQIQLLYEANIPVVIPAGNDFFTLDSQQGMSYPAIIRESISVGAVFAASEGNFSYGAGAKANSTRPGQITPFSQRLHAEVDSETRTDIFAPGAPITSSGINGDHGEATQHGTAQAAAVAAGVVLLMQEYHLRETGSLPSVADLVTWLRDGGVIIHDGDDEDDNVEHTDLDYVLIDVLSSLRLMQEEISQ